MARALYPSRLIFWQASLLETESVSSQGGSGRGLKVSDLVDFMAFAGHISDATNTPHFIVTKRVAQLCGTQSCG